MFKVVCLPSHTVALPPSPLTCTLDLNDLVGGGALTGNAEKSVHGTRKTDPLCRVALLHHLKRHRRDGKTRRLRRP